MTVDFAIIRVSLRLSGNGTVMGESETFQLDYQETFQEYRLLADIRFKLLALVPTISALAVTLLTENTTAETRLAIGLLGFIMTLGILLYELRNSKFYDASIHRLEKLDKPQSPNEAATPPPGADQ